MGKDQPQRPAVIAQCAKSLKKVHILERDTQALPSLEKHPKMKILLSTIFIYLSLRLHYFISIFRAL